MINKIKNTNLFIKIILTEVVVFVVVSSFSLIIKQMGIFSLLSLSLLCSSAIALLLSRIIKIYFIREETKTILLFSAISTIIGIIAYVFIIYNRNYEYLADYTCYYDLQYELFESFNRNVLKGIASIVISFWKSDYSYFICLFTSLPFRITTGSHNAFVLIYCIFLIAPVNIAINMFMMSVVKKSNIKENYTLFFIVGNAIILLFPLLQADALLGMPDIFGLAFLMPVAMILFNYDISTLSWKNNIYLCILTILSIITRRWIIFGLIGLYVAFAVFSLLFNVRMIKKVLVNGIKSFVFIGGITAFVLSPFIYFTIKADYQTSYKAWSYGGVFWELCNQCRFLGVLIVAVMLVGLIVGLLKTELRFYTLISFVGIFISIFCFTRVQNMMSHHALCLMGMYLPLILNTLLFCLSFNKKFFRIMTTGLLVLVFAFNIAFSFSGKIQKSDRIHILTNINLCINNKDTHKNAWE